MTGNSAAHGVPLVNTRTTFQRTRDARFFTGRIRKFSQKVLSVVCDQEFTLEAGERFSFHVFGSGQEALFFADYRQEATAADPALREYVFVLQGEINLRKSTQDPRFVTQSIYADIEAPGLRKCDGIKVFDISANGLCASCPTHIRKGDPVKLTIHQQEGFIQADAEVRYCIKDRANPTQHRIGLRLLSLDRISLIRWRNFYAQIVHSSRYDAHCAQLKAS